MVKIPIEISNRHVHPSRKDLNVLFGKGYKLKIAKKLSQTGQFAAKEKVTLINKGKKIERVRLLGPTRKKTQVELSKTNCEDLGIKAPLKESGNLKGSSGITIEGPKGTLKLKSGVIIVKRHLHASDKEAKKLGLKNGQLIKVKVKKKIFDKIIVRIDPSYKLAVHLDTDEGKLVGIYKRGFGELILE